MIQKTQTSRKKDKKGSSNTGRITQYGILVVLVLSLLYVTILSPSITGLSTGYSEEITKELDLTFDSYSAYSFTLEGKPTSIKLSGTVDGTAKIYLLNGFDKYLIYETSENSGNILTGFAIGIPSEVIPETNETEVNETIVPNLNEDDSNQNSSEQINESDETSENNETIIDEIVNETNNSDETVDIVDDVIENITETNNLELPVDNSSETNTNKIEIPELGLISFSNSCIDTCSLTDFDETIELVIEVNGILTLTKLTYTIEGSEEIIENITLEINDTTQIVVNTTLELNETEILNDTLELNLTEVNLTNLNETLPVFNETVNFLESVNCNEFTEQVLWSSGFSNSQHSINYQVWNPKYNCESINSTNCFIGKIEIKARFVSVDTPELNGSGEGYVQISETKTCDNPEDASYLRYLAYQVFSGEEIKSDVQCGENKNPNLKCGVEATSVFDKYDYSDCFGIKTYSTQHSIADVFEVRYSLCEDENE